MTDQIPLLNVGVITYYRSYELSNYCNGQTRTVIIASNLLVSESTPIPWKIYFDTMQFRFKYFLCFKFSLN